MSSTTTQIRLDVIARLKAAATAAGDRVDDNRSTPQPDRGGTFPALAVYTSSGSREALGPRSAGVFMRTERIQVDGWVTGETDAELARALDELEDQVHQALLGDDEWVNQFEEVGRVTSERGQETSGARRLGAMVVVYEVKWRERWTTAVESSLRLVHVDVDLAPPDGTLEAQARVELEGA